MKFTVVIPLYNKERHIKRAIKSVIQQTYQDFEIIIVDDGSTDKSVDEAMKVKDYRIRIVQKMVEFLCTKQRSEESNYNFIGFLDADDAWKPDF